MNSFVRGVVALLLVSVSGVSVAETVESANKRPVVTADVFQPGGTTDTGALRVTSKNVVVYDSGNVAAGAIISSPVIDVSGFGTCTAKFDNSAGGSARNLAVYYYADDGTTQLTGFGAAVALGTTTYAGLGASHQASGLTSVYQYDLPPKATFGLSAAGSAIGRVMVWCR